jgi:hypothetical protein
MNKIKYEIKPTGFGYISEKLRDQINYEVWFQVHHQDRVKVIDQVKNKVWQYIFDKIYNDLVW